MANEYKVKDIVLVKFPFTDLIQAKKRPALVLKTNQISSKNRIYTIAMVTSQTENFLIEGDVVLKEWKKSNLLHPSLVRLGKLATIEDKLVDSKIGEIQIIDLKAIKKDFTKLYKFWIN